jgi:signal peptidase I
MPPWVGVLLTALLAAVLAFFFGATRSYFVPSDSMVPTLLQGDEFRADTFFALQAGPKRGEIWVITNPSPNDGNGPVLVKRVIGLPGEKVATDGGVVTINGKPLDEPYCAEKPDYQLGPKKLGPDEYWLLGDNRNRSEDSHKWGPLPKSLLIGKAVVRYWPLSRMKWF